MCCGGFPLPFERNAYAKVLADRYEEDGAAILNEHAVPGPRPRQLGSDRHAERGRTVEGHRPGLSIVYGVAKEAGGTVSFFTSRNEGTTFEVLLPLVASL